MLRVGLTGGLGSGKTTVAKMFAALGAHVIEADEIGRAMMQPGQPVFDEIVEHFGPGVLRSDGTLDRKALSKLAFSHGREGGRLEELNRIVHPAVIAAQEEWARGLFARDPAAIAMVESALVFEVARAGTSPGWRNRFERIVLVTAPDDQKIARYMARVSPQGWDEAVAADARARLASQIPDSEKAAMSEYVIDNSGSVEQTERQVAAIFAELKKLSEERVRQV